MKTLVIGCNGQLGQSMHATVPDRAQVIGVDLPELDITDAKAVATYCDAMRPDVIVNAAAYTAVDNAELEAELATAVNVAGPRNIVAAARAIEAQVVHISTDFVFDGMESAPYKTDAATDPLGVYGRTKRDGEIVVLETLPDSAVVIRTSWLYSKTGNNFVTTMLRLMQERDEIGIVSDQIGTPTWANSLAKAVWAFAARPELCGLFHWSDRGEATWHDFAVAIQQEALTLGLLDRPIPVHAIATEDYPTAAARPRYSVLDCSLARTSLGMEPDDWRENLRNMLKGLTD